MVRNKVNGSNKIRISLFSFILIITFLGFFSTLRVKRILISSDSGCVDKSQVGSALKNIMNKSILLVDQEKIKKDVKKNFLCIGLVRVSKDYPDKLSISLSSRKPIAIFELIDSEDNLKKTLSIDLKKATDSPVLNEVVLNEQKEATISGRFLIDVDGFLYSKDVNSDLPIISGFIPDVQLGKAIDSQIIKNSVNILGALKTLEITPEFSRLRDQKYLKVKGLVNTQSKHQEIELFFSLNGDHVKQLASLQLILTKARIDLKSIRSADLRFDQPVVIYD